MSDYDFRAAQNRGSNALDYSRSSGGSIWVALGVVALLVIGVALFAAFGGGTGDGTAPADPAAATAPAADPAPAGN